MKNVMFPRRQHLHTSMGDSLIAGVVKPSIHPQANFPPPQQLSPPNRSVFNNFPRTTTLKWAPVSGAASYAVELDCFQCCAANKWCTAVGKTWQIVTGITTTQYTFDWVGAQPGRWRVWAVGPKGRNGRKTKWWRFRYTV
jgi:eukaryotic-like serine/threonine-protein kinase